MVLGSRNLSLSWLSLVRWDWWHQSTGLIGSQGICIHSEWAALTGATLLGNVTFSKHLRSHGHTIWQLFIQPWNYIGLLFLKLRVRIIITWKRQFPALHIVYWTGSCRGWGVVCGGIQQFKKILNTPHGLLGFQVTDQGMVVKALILKL